jgi:hypothetical protein
MTVTASTDSVDQIRAPLDRCLSEPQAAERIKAGKHLRCSAGTPIPNCKCDFDAYALLKIISQAALAALAYEGYPS